MMIKKNCSYWYFGNDTHPHVCYHLSARMYILTMIIHDYTLDYAWYSAYSIPYYCPWPSFRAIRYLTSGDLYTALVVTSLLRIPAMICAMEINLH